MWVISICWELQMYQLYIFLHQPFPALTPYAVTSLLHSESWDALWSLDERQDLNSAYSLSAGCYTSCSNSSRSRCVYLLCHSSPPPSSCSFITAVRQLCLGGSHSIVLAPPSTYECSCRCWCRSARPTPPCGTGWLQITVILFTYVPWVGYAYVFLSLLSLDRACYTRCCTPPPSCYCLCYWSACLCCTQTKSSNSACGCFHATPVCAQLCHNAVLRTSYRTHVVAAQKHLELLSGCFFNSCHRLDAADGVVSISQTISKICTIVIHTMPDVDLAKDLTCRTPLKQVKISEMLFYKFTNDSKWHVFFAGFKKIAPVEENQ